MGNTRIVTVGAFIIFLITEVLLYFHSEKNKTTNESENEHKKHYSDKFVGIPALLNEISLFTLI